MSKEFKSRSYVVDLVTRERVFVTPANQPLRTVVVEIETEDGVRAVGTAVTSPEDTYNFSDGHDLAVKRAVETLTGRSVGDEDYTEADLEQEALYAQEDVLYAKQAWVERQKANFARKMDRILAKYNLIGPNEIPERPEPTPLVLTEAKQTNHLSLGQQYAYFDIWANNLDKHQNDDFKGFYKQNF